jgi:soluble lytic murein transglycosylase
MKGSRHRPAVVLVATALSCGRQHDAATLPHASALADGALSASPAHPPLADALAESDAASHEAGADARANAVAKTPTTWVEDVRSEQWADAAVKIDALPETERKLPEMRYVRARVALSMGDAKVAADGLDGLDQSLPLLAGDIAHHLAEARRVVGPFDKAAEYFGAHATPGSLLAAADSYEKAHDNLRARAVCQRVIGFAKKTRLEEAEARACELRLGTGPEANTLAIGDARWIAIHAPDSPWGTQADQALTKLAPSHPLLGEELMIRAQAFADAGRVDEALAALDKVALAPSPKVPHLFELRMRGEILYKTRGRALEAAKVLEESAALGGSHAVEDSFHAARALARADHDDDATQRLAQIARNHRGTRWGDEADFFVPYLALLHGKWREAAAGFDEYLKSYPKGVERRDAEHGGALAHLMNEDFGAARRLFEEVAVEESDALAAARARELAGLAALRDGDKLHAVASWTALIESYPLSWAALVARTRLQEIHAPLPPWAHPYVGAKAASHEPLVAKLPPPADVLHKLGLDRDAESALHEREGVVLGEAPPGRGLEALCAAYGVVGRARRRFHLVSQIPLDALHAAPGPENRWAWECAYPTPFSDHVRAPVRAFGHGLDEALVYGIMRQESNFDPDAISPAHAVGLMQLLPETARLVAGEAHQKYDDAWLTQPPLNVLLAVRYLGDLDEKFDKSPAHLPLMVASYNAGEEAVSRWISRASKMDVDEFVERIPYAETRGYVAHVMGNWAHYEYLLNGEAGVPEVRLALSN